jgi:hypothetical protein
MGKEQITSVEGLSALSLDALTSVAYGPEAIIVVLALAGAGSLHLVLQITLAIVALLAIGRSGANDASTHVAARSDVSAR